MLKYANSKKTIILPLNLLNVKVFQQLRHYRKRINKEWNNIKHRDDEIKTI